MNKWAGKRKVQKRPSTEWRITEIIRTFKKNSFSKLIQEFIKIEAWLLLTLLSSIKFYAWHYHILKSTNVWKRWLAKWKWTVAFSNKFYSKSSVGFYINTGKRFFVKVSFLSQQKVLLKNGIRDFQNSPPFDCMFFSTSAELES